MSAQPPVALERLREQFAKLYTRVFSTRKKAYPLIVWDERAERRAFEAAAKVERWVAGADPAKAIEFRLRFEATVDAIRHANATSAMLKHALDECTASAGSFGDDDSEDDVENAIDWMSSLVADVMSPTIEKQAIDAVERFIDHLHTLQGKRRRRKTRILTPSQKKILDALDGRVLTLPKLLKRVDTKERQTKYILKQLIDAKLVISRRGAGYYRIDAPPVALTKHIR